MFVGAKRLPSGVQLIAGWLAPCNAGCQRRGEVPSRLSGPGLSGVKAARGQIYFEAWHFALNYWYLPKDHADGRRFDAQLRRRGLDFYRTKPLRDRWAHAAIERSWDRIFTIRRNAKSVQACLWEVPVSAVTDITVFTGRSRGAI